jgi:hypothetical protein
MLTLFSAPLRLEEITRVPHFNHLAVVKPHKNASAREDLSNSKAGAPRVITQLLQLSASHPQGLNICSTGTAIECRSVSAGGLFATSISVGTRHLGVWSLVWDLNGGPRFSPIPRSPALVRLPVCDQSSGAKP